MGGWLAGGSVGSLLHFLFSLGYMTLGWIGAPVSRRE